MSRTDDEGSTAATTTTRDSGIHGAQAERGAKCKKFFPRFNSPFFEGRAGARG